MERCFGGGGDRCADVGAELGKNLVGAWFGRGGRLAGGVEEAVVGRGESGCAAGVRAREWDFMW